MSEKPAYTKPLPDLRPEDATFWEALKEHRFIIPCDDAGKPFWYPRKYAPGTLDATGNGTIYSYSTHFMGPSKAYKGDPPHIVALIDLEEGPRMMSILVKDEEGYPSLDHEDVTIGMKVKLVFDDVTDEVTMPRFTPAG